MSLYERVCEDIKKKSDNKKNNIIDGIPFPLERYRPYVPLIEKGIYAGVLGSSGVGKSTFTRFVYLYSVISFAIENNYPVKVMYFALEDNKEKIMKKIISHYLYVHYGVSLSFHDINSRFKPLPPDIVALLEKEKAFFDKLEKILFIIDTVSSPNGIKIACDYAKEKGTITDEDHVVAIIDNFDNVTPDKEDDSKWAAINRLSAVIIRLDFCKMRNFSVLAVLQADMEQEKHSFRAAGSGKVAVSSIEPSLASIGGSKEVARHVHLLFGIFNPWRYEIEYYPSADGYNTGKLKNNFRSLLLLKTNDGEIPYGRLGMFFNGKVEEFAELPLTENKDQLEAIYREVEARRLESRQKFTQKEMFEN